MTAVRSWGPLAAVLATLAGWPSEARACAACRNPNLPQSRMAGASQEGGVFGLTAALQSTALWVSHPAGCADPSDCTEVPAQPRHSHELFILPLEVGAALDWAITDTLGLEAYLPFRLVHVSASYETPDGRSYTPIDARVHHRDETLVGLGDGQLRFRVTTVIEGWWLTGRLGLSVPLGSNEPDPFALGDRGLEHQHIQFGTGTLDPLVGLDLTRSLPASEWSLYGQAQHSFYENSHGYRAGTRGLVGASGGWKAAPAWLLSMTLEGAFEGAERWGGQVRQDGMLGRYEVLLGAQAQWRSQETIVGAALRTPVLRHLVEGQDEPGELTSPLSLSVSVTQVFR